MNLQHTGREAQRIITDAYLTFNIAASEVRIYYELAGSSQIRMTTVVITLENEDSLSHLSLEEYLSFQMLADSIHDPAIIIVENRNNGLSIPQSISFFNHIMPNDRPTKELSIVSYSSSTNGALACNICTNSRSENVKNMLLEFAKQHDGGVEFMGNWG